MPKVKLGPNVSTTPLWQWGFWQCLHSSSTTLGGKHCWHPIAVMGVVELVDMFGHCLETAGLLSLTNKKQIPNRVTLAY